MLIKHVPIHIFYIVFTIHFLCWNILSLSVRKLRKSYCTSPKCWHQLMLKFLKTCTSWEDLINTWTDVRYWFKLFFDINPTCLSGLEAKVTSLEFFYGVFTENLCPLCLGEWVGGSAGVWHSPRFTFWLTFFQSDMLPSFFNGKIRP